MRKIRLLILLFSAFHLSLAAQEADTTIYQVVEQMPLFADCDQLDTTLQAKRSCSEQQLLSFVYSQVTYPPEAREEGLEGTTVVSFVVEPDGTVSNPEIVRDVGGGTGLEVLRVINLMNEQGLRWTPGRRDGSPVRVRMNLPVKFELEEALPYVLAGRDTLYVRYDSPPAFQGGDEALRIWLGEKLDYPEEGNDSCRVGSIDMQLIIQPDGRVRIYDMIDYNDLGFDFWYEAIDAATSTAGKWEPAVYEGRKVKAAYDITLSFAPTVERCQERVESYQQAGGMVNEGLELLDAGESEAGIAKLDEAVALFPDDANFLFIRGQANLDLNRLDEACADLRKASDIALVNWYAEILPLICR